MGNIVVQSPEKLERIKKLISKEGVGKFHVITDFDKTFTKEFVNGKKISSILSILRSSGDYLGDCYEKKAHELFEKYGQIEDDHKISMEKKKRAMHEWWTKHFDLLLKSGLNKKDLEKVIENDKIHFRNGVLELIDYLKDKSIPLRIMSSSGLGDAIAMLLERKKIV